MDSSLAQEFAQRHFSPLHIKRLAARLAHYRSSNKHSWERIALDVLSDDGLPAGYVEDEDVRPFSESLRRLDNGSQVPSKARLHALAIFLVNQGYIHEDELDIDADAAAAPLALTEFSRATIRDFESLQSELSESLSGTFSRSVNSEDRFLIETLGFEPDGSVIRVQLTTSHYDDPGRKLNLAENKKLRGRATHYVRRYAGWVFVISPKRIIFVLAHELFEHETICYSVYARERSGEETGIVSRLLLLTYLGARDVPDFSQGFLPGDSSPSIRLPEVFAKTIGNAFREYERGEL